MKGRALMSEMRDFIKKSKTHFTLHNLRTWYEMSVFTIQETTLSRHNIWGLQSLAASFGVVWASIGHKPPKSGNKRKTKMLGRR